MARVRMTLMDFLQMTLDFVHQEMIVVVVVAAAVDHCKHLSFVEIVAVKTRPRTIEIVVEKLAGLQVVYLVEERAVKVVSMALSNLMLADAVAGIEAYEHRVVVVVEVVGA